MQPITHRRTVRLTSYDYSADGSYFITVCTQHKEHRFGHISDDTLYLNEADKMIAERIEAIVPRFPGTLIDSYVVMPNHIHFILTLLPPIPDNVARVGAAHRGRPPSETATKTNTTHTPPPDPAFQQMQPTFASDDWLIYSGVDISGEDEELESDIPGMDLPGMDVPGMDVPGMDVPGMDEAEPESNPISDPCGPRTGGHDGPPLHGQRHTENGQHQTGQGKQHTVADIVGWLKASSTNYYIKGVKAGVYPAFDGRLWQRNYYEHIIRTDKAYKLIDDYIRTNQQRWNEDRLR